MALLFISLTENAEFCIRFQCCFFRLRVETKQDVLVGRHVLRRIRSVKEKKNERSLLMCRNNDKKYFPFWTEFPKMTGL